MRHYRIKDKYPRPPWRRKKGYTVGELRWLARRNGWLFRHHKKLIEVTEQDGRPVATFAEVPEAVPPRPVSERLALFAILRV